MSTYTQKKLNNPLGFIVLQKQLAFTLGSRNKQVILDSYQSEIFCYTMNPLTFKPREYKLSCIDQACSVKMTGYQPRSFSTFFWTENSSQSLKTQKKKTRPTSSHLTSRLVNNAQEYISCRLIQIWQGKTVQKMHFRARNLSDVQVSGLPFSCNAVHKVLTSALITQVIVKICFT